MSLYPCVSHMCGPYAGVVGSPSKSTPLNVSDRAFSIYTSKLGNLTALDPNIVQWTGRNLEYATVAGAGSDIDKEYAKFKAVAEALERYSSCIINEDEYIVASAVELGNKAADWRKFPAPSDAELSRARHTQKFDPNASIRWIETHNIAKGENKYLPLAFTHLYPKQWTSERFYWPISTGTALHTDIHWAIVKAILEAVERDAIALTWLLNITPPLITFKHSDVKAHFDNIPERIENTSEFRYYDVTTDLGIPTVYLRRVRPGHPHASNLVTCATDLSFVSAVKSASRESASTSLMFDTGMIRVPEHPSQCYSIEDGAAFMGQPKNSHFFDFLDTGGERSFGALDDLLPESETSGKRALAVLLNKLSVKDLDIYVADLTVDELRDSGLCSIKVFIPQLMPMSTVSECRYLGHKRLYDYAKFLGKTAFSESDVNKNPQPFA
jgi:ribosomal protein S12 methylthiotransferase accessory factor